MNVAILYGWAEGPWHSNRLPNSLVAHNFALTKDVQTADIIICHSGGCYMVPPNKAKLILMVGPPYWPGASMGKRVLKKTYQDFMMHHSVKELQFWFNKTAHNAYYMLVHFNKWIKMHGRWKAGAFPISEGKQKIVVVRNKNDAFCKRSAIIDLCSERSWDIIELPGEHDDLWIRPEHYLEIIKKKL